jgi:hypothetical protein
LPFRREDFGSKGIIPYRLTIARAEILQRRRWNKFRRNDVLIPSAF